MRLEMHASESQARMQHGKKSRALFMALGIFLGLLIALQQPPSGLTVKAMQALGLLATAIFFWIVRIWDDYIVALGMALGWVVLDIVPFETAFATFHSKTWWLMAGALGLGAGVARSGLLRRGTLIMLKLLPATYIGQTLALVVTGVIACPAIPSVIAKVSIAGKFIPELASGMGFAERSKATAGLFLSMYLGFVLAAPMYLTATSTNMFLVELLPEAEQLRMTWGFWLQAAWLPALLAVISGYVTVLWLYKPKQAVVADHATVARELQALGPLRREERITLAILLVAIVLWVTENLHGQKPAVVALAGLVVMLATGVIDKKTFHSDLGWSSLLFIGVILNLGSVFPALGIDKFLGVQAVPVLGPLTTQPFLFIALLLGLTIALRFVVVSMNALLAILMLVLLPVVQSAGISAWAVGMVIHFASHCVWFMLYQNAVFAIGVNAAEGKAITDSEAARFSLIFTLITVCSVLLAVPYWRWMGLI